MKKGRTSSSKKKVPPKQSTRSPFRGMRKRSAKKPKPAKIPIHSKQEKPHPSVSPMGFDRSPKARNLPTSASSPSGTSLRTELPFSYNETKLVLLVRDPLWGYSYWDFSADTWAWIQDLYQRDPGTRAKLRIHNLSQGGFFDIDVNLDAKNWYLCLDRPNTEFEAELGLLGSDGTFHMIARSNRIRTPRNKPSEIIDPEWEPKHFEEIYRLSGGYGSSRSSWDLFSQFMKRP